MELYSMLSASLDGSGVWERTDTCICMAEFLRCSAETTTTLFISYTPIQRKNFKVWKKKWERNKNDLKDLFVFLNKQWYLLTRRKETCMERLEIWWNMVWILMCSKEGNFQMEILRLWWNTYLEKSGNHRIKI